MGFSLFTKMFIEEARNFLGCEIYIKDLSEIDQESIKIKLEKGNYQQFEEKVIVYSYNEKIPSNLVIEDISKLERLLQNYIYVSIGFRFNYDKYLEAIRLNFKNILLNASVNDFKNINKFIEVYTQKIVNLSSDYPLSSSLIEVIKKSYSPYDSIICIRNLGNKYSFNNIDKKNEYLMPTAIINDINVIEKTIKSTLEEIIKSDSLFNRYFSLYNKEEAITHTLNSILRNATPMDLFDLNAYFLKYKGFFEDNSLDEFKSKVKIGTLFGEELYLLCRRANADYETPYFLSFFLQNEKGFIELPNVRLGINENNGKKTAHILAVQASQDNTYIDEYRQMELKIKHLIKNKSKIRFFNPMFIASLSLTFGLLKKLGIKEIEYANYLPLRWQRKEKEEGISEDFLINLQQQLTDKNINNFLKMCEYFKNTRIKLLGDEPEQNMLLDISSDDLYECDNEFLRDLFYIGYNSLIDENIKRK